MSRYLRAGVIAGLLAGVCWYGPAALRADPRWADRLHAEAVPAWDAERARSVAVHGTSRRSLKTKTKDGSERVSKLVYTRKANQEAALVTVTDIDRNHTDLYAYNTRYTFRLRSTGEDRWALTSIHFGEDEKDSNLQWIRKNIEIYSAIFDLGNHVPHDLALFTTHLRKPTTRVTSVSPVVVNGAEVMEVRLDLHPADKADELRSVTRLCDPGRNWRTIRTTATGVQKNLRRQA
jgi:hypothetical protein